MSFTEANAQELPMAPNTYDMYTIAFGIRNCTNVPLVLSEAYRVLKPGGTFACLEFSKVNNPLLSTSVLFHSSLTRCPLTLVYGRIYDQYSFSVIPLLGNILVGDRDSYQYLVESIRRFPSQPDFAQMIKDAGFATGEMREGKGGTWRDLWGGVACIHTGVKL